MAKGSWCPLCECEHEDGPVGEPGTVFEGIEIRVCPKVPEDTVYFHAEYAKGPKGAIFLFQADT